jgi:RecA-family ATPase
VPVLHRDIETRSALDLKKVGAFRYAADKSTDVWCVGYAVDGGAVEMWIPGGPIPQPFIDAAANSEWIVVAHNDQFESAIEHHILAPRYGWPLAPIERHHCTMAMALAGALPGKLDNVAAALGLAHQKDKAGQRLMLRLSRVSFDAPSPEKLQQLYAYCRNDVEIERELHHRLLPLSATEQALWVLDQTINCRGFRVDTALAYAAREIVRDAEAEINARITTLTNGAVTSVGQVERILSYLAARGHEIKDLTKRSISAALANGLDEHARELLGLRQAGARASVKKLETLLASAGADDRIRGGFRYHGASTGRWSGSLFQAQNLKKPEIDDVTGAVEAVLAKDSERISALGKPLTVIGSIARPMICAALGYVLIGADFSAIESRVLAWLAQEQWKLDNYRDFDCTGDPALEPYCVTASKLLGRKVTAADKADRKIGKTADLALGFGGSVPAWRRSYKDDARSDEAIKQNVDSWRRAHPAIARFWRALEGIAHRAIHTGRRIELRNIAAEHVDGTLHLTLPSGRRLAYPQAQLVTGEFENAQVQFRDNAKGGFLEARAWHGTFAENVTQAIARDLLAAAMLRLETTGFPIVLHVHDEIVAEVLAAEADQARFLSIMTELPAWATGLPIAAEAWSAARYGCDSEAPAAEAPPRAPEQSTQLPPEPEGATMRDDDNDYCRGNKARGDGPDHWVADYIYRDKHGQPYLRVQRFENAAGEKTRMPQAYWNGGSWHPGKPTGPKLPYRLPELLAAAPDAPVWICEGEKDAYSVAALGLITTTNSEGAGQWTDDLNPHFAGKRTVYLLQDNDEAGRERTAKIAKVLLGIVSDIRVIAFPELPEHGDVSDWLGMGGNKQLLLARAEAAASQAAKPKLPFIDMSRWDEEPAPEREWAVFERIPMRAVSLFSGEGGGGKSKTQLQLNTAHVFGAEWLLTYPLQGPSIFVDAEDDVDELHRRMELTLRHYGKTFAEATKAGLHLISLAGDDAVLAVASKGGKIEPTPRYDALLEAASDIKPRMIGIASAADVFAGNENDRPQVQQFITLLTRIAIRANGAVQLISHPSLTGINTDTGLSGSTQWHNSVRARSYLRIAKPEPGAEPRSNAPREIVFKKSNYGPDTASIVLEYRNGLYLPIEGVASLDRVEQEARAKEVFIELLQRFTAENRKVVAAPSRSYAPPLFAEEDEARKAGLTKKALEIAMRALFKAGKIWNEPCGKPSEPRFRLALKS